MDPEQLPEPFDIEELLTIYLDSGAQSVAALGQALEEMLRDGASETGMAQVEQLAHRIKGASFQFGFRQAGEVAQRMETLAYGLRKGDRESGPADLEALLKATACLGSLLESIRNQTPAPDISETCHQLEERSA